MKKVNESIEIIDPMELVGEIVDRIEVGNDVKIFLQKGPNLFIGCAGGAMVSILGDVENIRGNEVESVDADKYQISIRFDNGETIDFEDETGGEGLELWADTQASMNEGNRGYEETRSGERYQMEVIDALQSMGMSFNEADNMIDIEYELVGDYLNAGTDPYDCAEMIKSKHRFEIDESFRAKFIGEWLNDHRPQPDKKGEPTIELTAKELHTFMNDVYDQAMWSKSSYKIVKFMGMDPTQGT